MSGLVEFLLARIAEEEDANREAFLAGVPDADIDQATEAWDRLAMTAWLRSSIALRQLGWSICGTYGLRRRLQRKVAAKYAKHPDYRQEWRLTGAEIGDQIRKHMAEKHPPAVTETSNAELWK